MNDRRRGGFDDHTPRDVDGTGDAVDMSAVLDLDRLLDETTAGHAPRSGDPLLELLGAARAELDERCRTRPVSPPDLSVLLPVPSDTARAEGPVPDAPVSPGTVVSPQEGRHRRRRGGLRRLTGRAAAAGGLSVTGMVIAGGVAAALAVGGFGVAAYHGAIPGIPARGEVDAPRGTGDTSTTQSSVPAGSSGETAPSDAPRRTAAEKSRTPGATAAPGPTGGPESTVAADPTETTEEPEPTGVPDPGTEETVPGAPEPTDAPSEPTDVPTEPDDGTGPGDGAGSDDDGQSTPGDTGSPEQPGGGGDAGDRDEGDKSLPEVTGTPGAGSSSRTGEGQD